MEDKEKRGSHAKRSWEAIKKAGGIAPSPSAVRSMLTEDTNGLLTREELVDRISRYFESCIREVVNDDTHELTTMWVRAPSKTGLAAAIGVDLQTLIDYVNGIRSDGKPFSDIPNSRRRVASGDFDVLRKAYSIISTYYEEQLSMNKNNSGSIFWLLNGLNSRWSNEQTVIRREDKKITLTADQLPSLAKNQERWIDARVLNEKPALIPYPKIKGD